MKPHLEVGRTGNPITGNTVPRPHISFTGIESNRTIHQPDSANMYFETWKEMQQFFLQAAVEATEQMKLEKWAESGAPDEALVDAIAEQFISQALHGVARTMEIPPEPKPIRIILDGGLIQEIRNMPDGLAIEVYDYDVARNDDHPNIRNDEQGKRAFVNIWTKEGHE